MKTEVQLSEDLSLPAQDFIESAIGIIGKRNRGKSGTVKVIMEELVQCGMPFVAFDPVGIMWGLRSSVDGKESGYSVLVIGGKHGDIPLDRKSGEKIAEAIVKANVSAIIDFSGEPHSAYREFITDFSLTLFRINNTPRMVIIEEAPVLVPQTFRGTGDPQRAKAFDAVESLVSRGRNKGIGVILVSQRASTLNKDVLTQVDTLMVLGLTAPIDKKALTEWIKEKDEPDKEKQFYDGLAGLQKQEAWFWSPEFFGRDIFQKIRIRNYKTFHPDLTNLRRMGLLDVHPVTTDVSSVVEALKKTLEVNGKNLTESYSKNLTSQQKEIERLKRVETDLKKRIAVLEGKLKSNVNQQKPIDLKPVIAQVDRINTMIENIQPLLKAIPGLIGKVEGISIDFPMNSQSDITEIKLNRGERKILETIASRYPMEFTRTQMATLSGFSPSSGTYSNYYSNLKRSGFIEELPDKKVKATQSGMDFLGKEIPKPQTSEEILAMWKSIFPVGAVRILDTLIEIYPQKITREELANRVGFSYTSGTFSNYISMLKKNKLMLMEDGFVYLNPVLKVNEK